MDCIHIVVLSKAPIHTQALSVCHMISSYDLAVISWIALPLTHVEPIFLLIFVRRKTSDSMRFYKQANTEFFLDGHLCVSIMMETISACQGDKGHNLFSSSQRSLSFPPSVLHLHWSGAARQSHFISIKSANLPICVSSSLSFTHRQGNPHLFSSQSKITTNTHKQMSACSCAVTSSKYARFALSPGGLLKRPCTFRGIITKEAGSSLCSNFSHVSHFLESKFYGLWGEEEIKLALCFFFLINRICSFFPAYPECMKLCMFHLHSHHTLCLLSVFTKASWLPADWLDQWLV